MSTCRTVTSTHWIKIAMAALVILAVTAGSAAAKVSLVGKHGPIGNVPNAGFCQAFVENGIPGGLSFDHVQFYMISGHNLMATPVTLSAFSSAPNWNQSCDDGVKAAADGDPTPEEFYTQCWTDNTQPFTMLFQAWLGSTLQETDVISWTPSGGFAISVTYPGAGTWPGGDARICPGFNSNIYLEDPKLCITQTTPCLDVPVNIARTDGTPMLGYSVEIFLDPSLQLCGNITRGDYLTNANTNCPTAFLVTNKGGGLWTVDETIACGTGPCGATAGNGTLFHLPIGKALNDGKDFITIQSATIVDCGGLPLPVKFTGPLSIRIDNNPPTPVTGLTATQQQLGNDNSGRTNIILTWGGGGGGSVNLYRADFGPGADPLGYPDYEGVAPTQPASCPPGAPWTLVAANASSPYVDKPPTRGFWYYTACVTDVCNPTAGPATMTTGTLDYHKGDVAPVATGNNTIDGLDIAELGAHYGLVGEAAVDPFDYLDISGNGPKGRPTNDDRINFNDLVLFAINFGHKNLAARAVPAGGSDALSVEAANLVRTGEIVTASLRLRGAGDIQALSAQLSWDRAVVEPVSVTAGDLITSQDGVVFSAAPGGIDAALLGSRSSGTGMGGEGVVATVTFRVLAAGNPKIGLASIDARDGSGEAIDLPLAGRPTTVLSTVTGLVGSAPNPFTRSTNLTFSLAQRGPAELSIYSVDGRRVKTLLRGTYEAGVRSVIWDGTDDRGGHVMAGVFYARLSTASGQFKKTISFVK